MIDGITGSVRYSNKIDYFPGRLKTRHRRKCKTNKVNTSGITK